MAKQQENREERRRKQFGGHRQTSETWPTQAPNPVFGAGEAPGDAEAGRPDQDQKAATGAGTGGATESDGRVVRHQATHATNTQKQ